MKGLIAFLCATLFALTGIGQELPDPKTTFQTQLESSCSSDFRIEKTVTDLDDEESKPEQKTFAVNCLAESVTNDSLALKQELAALFEQFYADPFLIEFYEVEESAGVLNARLKASETEEADLKAQSFSFSADGKILRQASAHIQRDTWFYEIDIKIEVQFDEQGKYSAHSQETSTKVLFFSDFFSTRIDARRLN